jgi:hypothetical protein
MTSHSSHNCITLSSFSIESAAPALRLPAGGGADPLPTPPLLLLLLLMVALLVLVEPAAVPVSL